MPFKTALILGLLASTPLAAQTLEELASIPSADPAREALCQQDGSIARQVADLRKRGITKDDAGAMVMQYVLDKKLDFPTAAAWHSLVDFVYARAASAPSEDFRRAALVLCRPGSGSQREYH